MCYRINLYWRSRVFSSPVVCKKEFSSANVRGEPRQTTADLATVQNTQRRVETPRELMLTLRCACAPERVRVCINRREYFAFNWGSQGTLARLCAVRRRNLLQRNTGCTLCCAVGWWDGLWLPLISQKGDGICIQLWVCLGSITQIN